MKLTKILLMALIALTFTTTANADGYKFKMCERAETAFWDTIANSNSSTDQSLVEIFGEKDQVAYYKMTLGKIEGSLAEVRKRCKGVASKDILDAYEKKKSEIESQISSL